MDVTLRTQRLLLRPPRLTDALNIARGLNNFAVAGNLARVPYPYREADAVAWVSSWRHDRPAEETGFAIDLPGQGVVGHCGFHRGDVGQAVLGYWLAEPFWNRGFMVEAAREALDWFFAVATLTSVESGVFHFNRASLAVQRKLGFTEVGESRVHCLARREDLRHIDTRLTRAGWLERQGLRPRDVA